MKEIPETFESVKHYAESFIFPLMEEVRFDLCSALERIDRAPHSNILSFKETSSHGQKPQNIYEIYIHGWNNASASGSKEDYKLLPGDILIISNIRPEFVDDLNRFGVHYIFVSVKGIEDDVESAKRFKVRAPKAIEFDDGALYAVVLSNMLPNSRIWKSLKSLGSAYSMSGNLDVVKHVLSADAVVWFATAFPLFMYK